MDAQNIEQYVLTNLYNLAQNVTTLPTTITTEEKLKETFAAELRKAKRMLINLENKAQKQWEAYEADIISVNELKEARGRLLLEKQQWQVKYDQINKQLNGSQRTDMFVMIQKAAHQMENLQEEHLFALQQQIVRELIHEIQIFNSMEIQICYLA